jgi:nitroreductase
MKPKPENLYPVHDFITRRWSPRAFSSKPVEKGKIMSLFEAVRWAASSRNEQPWRFIYASKSNEEAWQALFSCMGEWNQSWAKTADLLILAIARVKYYHKDLPNDHALYDLGLGLGNMTLQATSMGLFLHHMGGFDPLKARELFSISEPYQPVTMIAAGYPGEIGQIPEEIGKGEYNPQQRRELDLFAFEGFFDPA